MAKGQVSYQQICNPNSLPTSLSYPLEIWKASPSTTNGNEQAHQNINHDGVNLIGNTFKPENQWMQPSVDVRNDRYMLHLHQSVQPGVISSVSSQRADACGTFIERWGGSYTTMEELVWAMQIEHTKFPEYQPHLHYSGESSLCKALGDFIYNLLLYM